MSIDLWHYEGKLIPGGYHLAKVSFLNNSMPKSVNSEKGTQS